jgi:hypothetical protein
MRAAWILALGCLWGMPAWAGVVVWMEPMVPDSKTTEKADNKTGGTAHMGGEHLAFPPQPSTPADNATYDALRKSLTDGKKRWDEFEVEYELAVQIQSMLDGVGVVRDDRDLGEIVAARLFQGAAVAVAFEPDEFKNGDRAAPFRVDGIGDATNRPWLEAMAIDPGRAYSRSDVVDGASFPLLQKAAEVVSVLPAGKLTVPKLPAGAKLFVDGRETNASGAVEVRPGTHYAHLVWNGEISGRTKIDVASGGSAALSVLVDAKELSEAKAQVIKGSTAGFPVDVQKALDELAPEDGGAIFVAAIDDGKVVVLPYARNAALLKQRPVTVVGAGEIGGGATMSGIFAGSDGKLVTAPTLSGGLSLELGIYNGLILGGLDASITPMNTIAYGPADGSEVQENTYTSVLFQPWGGLGAYILRPTGKTPTLLIAGQAGWDQPAYVSYGGRISLGVLVDKSNTWFRMSLIGKVAPKSAWDEGDDATPMYSFFLRFGLSGLFTARRGL